MSSSKFEVPPWQFDGQAAERWEWSISFNTGMKTTCERVDQWINEKKWKLHIIISRKFAVGRKGGSEDLV